MKLRKYQKKNISEFFVNIATAWFLGGIITPWFTHQQISATMLVDLTISIVLTIMFLRESWKLYK